MRKLLFGLMLFCIASITYSQTASLKGSIRDTSENRNLHNSVVTVLRKADSVMVNFTRSNTEGNFLLKNIPAGNYIVMVTRPQYGSFVDEMTLATDEIKDM